MTRLRALCLVLALGWLTAPVLCQTIEFMDDNFRQAVVDAGYDMDGDEMISYDEAEMVTWLDLNYADIYDFMELEYFSNLEYLDVGGNPAWSIDISQLSALQEFRADMAELSEITVGHLPVLSVIEIMDCWNLMNLDLSESYALEEARVNSTGIMELYLPTISQLRYLDVSMTQLMELDLADQFQLETLYAGDTMLESLDLRPCTALQYAYLGSNWSLMEVCVTEVPPMFSYDIDDDSVFSTCGGSGGEEPEWIEFMDEQFFNFVMAHGADTDGDGGITEAEALAVTRLDAELYWSYAQGIQDLMDLEYFQGLRYFCIYEADLPSLFVQNLPLLDTLFFADNNPSAGYYLDTVEISNCPSLRHIEVGSAMGISDMQVDGCNALRSFSCNSCSFDNLDLSNQPNLDHIYMFSFGYLNTLDLSNCSSLRVLESMSVPHTELILSGCTGLEHLQFDDGDIMSLDFTDLTSLEQLWIGENPLDEVDLSNCSSLRYLDLLRIPAQLTLPASASLELCWLYGIENESLDFSGCTGLTELHLEENQSLSFVELRDSAVLNTFSIASCPMLSQVCVSAAAPLGDTNFEDPGVVSTCEPNPDWVYIPDPNLLQNLIDWEYDLDGDGGISYDEALAASTLIVGNGDHGTTAHLVEDLTGLEAFQNVTQFYLFHVNVSEISISGFPMVYRMQLGCDAVETMYVGENNSLHELFVRVSPNLLVLSFGALPALKQFYLQESTIDELDLSSLTTLESVGISGGGYISSVNLSGLQELNSFQSSGSGVQSVDFTGCPNLQELNLFRSEIAAFDASMHPQLRMVSIQECPIASLDFSSCTQLNDLVLRDLPLPELDFASTMSVIWNLYLGQLEIEHLDLRQTPVTNLSVNDCMNLTEILTLESYDETFYMENLVVRDTPMMERICVMEDLYIDYLNVDDPDWIQTCYEVAEADEQPAVFALQNAYPNPFNPTTTIRFSLAETGNARLALYNLSGQLVSVLHEGLTDAGEHQLVLDGSRLSSGVYLLSLRSEQQQAVQRITLLK